MRKEIAVTLKWPIPDPSSLSTEAQKSNFHKGNSSLLR